MCFITKKLVDQIKKVIIAEDITISGVKQFVGFDSAIEIFSYIESQEKKCFHEVMSGLENRKLYFDADKKVGEGEFPNIYDFMDDMKQVLIVSVKALFGVELSDDDICFTDSCTEDKFSSHIIVPSLNTSVASMKLLYTVVAGALSKQSELYDLISSGNNSNLISGRNTIGMKDFPKENNSSILDPNVYKSNQNLRLLHCNKMGKNNTKKLLTNHFTQMDTVISYLDNSTAINLKPEIQKILDEQYNNREKQLHDRLNTVQKSPEMFRRIITGLSQNRADDFGDWQRVCLALGHECAGVAIALEFARRSNKFNESATIKLYESGVSYSGRPVTIGTLLGMLKKDNISEFNKVIRGDGFVSQKNQVSDEIKQMIDSLSDDTPVKDNKPNTEPDLGPDFGPDFEPDFGPDFEPDFGPDFEPDFDPTETKPVKEKQEEKLARWLGNPCFYFAESVSDGKTVLDDKADLIQYSKRFMKTYPSIYDTYLIKAQKGQGKTVALEKYIKKHNPKRIVVISFRRSFSNEIMKRLSKLGFVNYRDIEGTITDDRVIIQVESLHRLKWTEKCDLMVLDEIESIRSQFFSPTCKFRNSVIEKYEMLLRSSKQVIAMDADISENTVKHLESVRPCQTKKTCYIENTHQEVQSQFKEFYTSNLEKIMPKICQALDNKQKIVIPTNRSVEFMAGLKKEIEEKYPDIKIQMYNSKSSSAVRDELQNVTTAWVKYDVVMYSPTVSAGVSFDEEHFDKCFCIFTNNGKINSMRQMISRVRHFSTNEYYYCLQSFGGSNKPDSVEAFERYICSNRFLYKPEFIMSKQKYDGTREYPYKDSGYWLWLYNETEKARDKNMFLYNFMREQYHAGVGEMSWLIDEPLTTKISKETVQIAKASIQMNEFQQIASATVINDTVKADIEKRMEEEKPVSANEIYSLQKRRLLDCYELGEREICPAFVELFNRPAMKSGYHNRKVLGKGLDVLMDEESSFFNAVFSDNVSVQDDLNKNYKSMKMVIAKELVEIAGFSGFYDTGSVNKDTMLASFKDKEKVLIKKMPSICDVLGKSKRRRPDISSWVEKRYLRNMLDFINSIITELFQLKIKQTSNKSGIYIIEGINQFNFSEDSIWFRPEAFETV